MRYLLDTNVCVMYLNGRSTSVRDRLHSIALEEMGVCSVVKAELWPSPCATWQRRVRTLTQHWLLTIRLVLSVLTIAIFYGAMRSNNPSRTLERQQRFLTGLASLPFDDAAAIICGRVRAHLASAGTPIGVCDLLIAAIALANNLTVVTHNIREFERVEGLPVEDWESAA